jgi:hypothetical protein
MNKLQFRVLYRHFLFRAVDLELISSGADINKLLGQFAALLIFVNSAFALGAFMGASSSVVHSLISLTMLAAGVVAVLSWDSMYPDARDVFVLGPLPVAARTIFVAKLAAQGTALGLTVVAANALTGIVVPFVSVPREYSILDLIFSTAFYRAFAAYWLTMAFAGALIFCSILTLQGIAASLLPRRWFLRLSSFLQIGAFCLFITVYFLEPSVASPRTGLPSYWFLAMFHQLAGPPSPLAPLATRAWTGVAIALSGAVMAYSLSYSRMMRKILEEPEILPAARGIIKLPPLGNSLETAIAHFSIRTGLRSRQHQLMLAFYVGAGLAIVILLMHSGLAQGHHLAESADTALSFSSFIAMTVWIIAVRVAFSMPVALRANWIFRATQIRRAPEYLASVRRCLFVLALAPLWLASAIFFLCVWPLRPATGHLVVLGLWGAIIAYASLHNFRKLPFTCSYLPGKSSLHIAFLAAIGGLILIGRGVNLEARALENIRLYIWLLSALLVVAAALRWRVLAGAASEEAIVQFKEQPEPALMSLGLNRDGVTPVGATGRDAGYA